VGLGNLYFKTGRNLQAVEILTRAIQVDSKDYEPLVLRGRAYARLNNYSAAVRDLEKALQAGATDPEIHYYLSQTYRAAGRPDESRKALEEFKRLRNKASGAADAQRDAARMIPDAKRLAEAGNVPGAIALLEKALLLDLRNPAILFPLAGLYFQNRQYEKARSAIRDAIALAPSQWNYHYLEGLIETGIGDFSSARNSLETALELNPSSAEAHNQLGDLCMQREDFASAVREFSSAAQLAPQETAYQTNLAEAKRRSRQRQQP
jgi:Flp pilus assembly protein TadD